MNSSTPHKVFGILIVILALVAGMYALFFHPYSSRVLQMHLGNLISGVPEDLKSATYLLSVENGSAIHKQGKADYAHYESDGSLAIEIAEAGGTKAMLLMRRIEHSIDVVVGGEVLLSSLEDKRSLAVSPDGSTVALIVCRDTMLASECTQIVTINVATKEMRELGPGVAVAFLDDATLVALTSDGGVAIDGTTGNRQELLYGEPLFLSRTAYLARSPDGTKLAWAQSYHEAHNAAVYGVGFHDGVWRAALIREIDEFQGRIALTNEHLYQIVPEKQGTRLVQHAFSSDTPAHLVRVMPRILSFSQLLP